MRKQMADTQKLFFLIIIATCGYFIYILSPILTPFLIGGVLVAAISVLIKYFHQQYLNSSLYVL